MTYRHPAARIHEIVQAPKALVVGQSVSPKMRGSRGLSFEAFGVFQRVGRSISMSRMVRNPQPSGCCKIKVVMNNYLGIVTNFLMLAFRNPGHGSAMN